MKTNYYNSRKLSIYSIIGLLALMVASCGSYQNKSYYDRDGIYGGESEIVAQTATNDGQAKTTESNKYTDYFNSLRDGQTDEVFTDVESYSSYKDTVATQDGNQSAAWGSNPSNVTVNVYDNNWGYNGWNNYWYGNYWGYNNLAWNSWYGPNWVGAGIHGMGQVGDTIIIGMEDTMDTTIGMETVITTDTTEMATTKIMLMVTEEEVQPTEDQKEIRQEITEEVVIQLLEVLL